MRVLKKEVLQIWRARKASIAADLADGERRAKAIQAKLDRLNEAFLFERSIDIDVYDRHAEKLREELTLLGMDRHASEVEDLDVEGSPSEAMASPRSQRRASTAGAARSGGRKALPVADLTGIGQC